MEGEAWEEEAVQQGTGLPQASGPPGQEAGRRGWGRAEMHSGWKRAREENGDERKPNRRSAFRGRLAPGPKATSSQKLTRICSFQFPLSLVPGPWEELDQPGAALLHASEPQCSF